MDNPSVDLSVKRCYQKRIVLVRLVLFFGVSKPRVRAFETCLVRRHLCRYWLLSFDVFAHTKGPPYGRNQDHTPL